MCPPLRGLQLVDKRLWVAVWAQGTCLGQEGRTVAWVGMGVLGRRQGRRLEAGL